MYQVLSIKNQIKNCHCERCSVAISRLNDGRDKGFVVPVILIIGGVIAVVAVLLTLWTLSGSKAKKPSPSPAPSLTSCKDRDYTGCDGPEVFQWKDDGKR